MKSRFQMHFAKSNSFSTESYANEQIKIVQSLFQNEIKYFNFKFQKNKLI